jgi:hypothetical protein
LVIFVIGVAPSLLSEQGVSMHGPAYERLCTPADQDSRHEVTNVRPHFFLIF